MARRIRWGILGCGYIAHRFAEDLSHSRYGVAAAAGSRTLDKARAFAGQYRIARAHGDYEALVNDPEVDVVYVATPHPFHMENTLAAIRAGKAVLCEKPLAMNARQARRMRQAAAKKGVFLMEGMWTRCFPAIRQVAAWLKEGRIGEVLSLHAEFGVRFGAGPEHRLMNPLLGGGALLDLGVYPISLASLVFGGPPERITGACHKASTGVDDQGELVFQYANGAAATLAFSSRVTLEQRASLRGTQGIITLEPDFFRPTAVVLKTEGKKARRKEFAHPGSGFQYEADHVARCLRAGQLESEIMPPAESVEIMQTMDAVRRQWGLKYPNE